MTRILNLMYNYTINISQSVMELQQSQCYIIKEDYSNTMATRVVVLLHDTPYQPHIQCYKVS